jgi:nucleoside-diphosphate-sugar epimerase
MKKTDKILVTGASGFIGSRLLKMLWESGYTNLRATSFNRDLRWDYLGCSEVEYL